MSEAADLAADLARLARRLERVESNATFQEDTAAKLDGEVRAVADRLTALEQAVRALQGQRSAADGDDP